MSLREEVHKHLEYYFGLPDKEGFYKSVGLEHKYRNYVSIDQATDAILKAVVKMLPKKIDIQAMTTIRAEGWNECLADIKSTMERK